ncbi:MAG: hypothetical protein WCY09_09140 [Candidatus Omnitrophota bacterium]
MVRALPGVAVNIQDLSTLPQGNSGTLAVGIVLQSNKGTLDQVVLQTSPTDLLTNNTYSGTVKPNDDKSFYTALNILQQTNLLYTSRAYSKVDPPLFGGLIVKKEDLLGNIIAITASNISTLATIQVSGDVSSLINNTDTIRIYGVPNTRMNGLTYVFPTRLTVSSVLVNNDVTTITVNEDISSAFTYASGTQPKAFKTRQPIPFNQQLIGAITAVSISTKTITLAGDLTSFLPEGDKILIAGSTGNNGVYKIVSSSYVNSQIVTNVVVAEPIPNIVADGNVFRHSIVDPNNYEFQPEDLFILTGKDQGSYNGNIEINIISSKESPDSLTESDVMQIAIYDALQNEQLELPYLVSRKVGSKATDGTSLYIEDVLINSAYVQAINNTNVEETELPSNTTSNVQMSGGYDGGALTDADLVAALSLFEDKVIPIDIIANGSIETPVYQAALVNLAETRLDIIAFLNSRLVDEKLATNSARASAVVNYKKGGVTSVNSTSFYAAMYAPHVTIADTFNSRQITIGADAMIIPGWLKVINSQGYPFAFAGYQYGKVNNMTTAWKIGDSSGEATILNDASVNFIAFDAIQNAYIAWTQNTLQIANSALRNLGAVFNILDMKKTLSVYLKRYLQLPITTSLRRTIADDVNNFMDGVKASGRVGGYSFKDISSSADISNNTLRFVLTLSPTNYAQQIYLVMRIVNQTFDFQILQNL